MPPDVAEKMLKELRAEAEEFCRLARDNPQLVEDLRADIVVLRERIKEMEKEMERSGFIL